MIYLTLEMLLLSEKVCGVYLVPANIRAPGVFKTTARVTFVDKTHVQLTNSMGTKDVRVETVDQITVRDRHVIIWVHVDTDSSRPISSRDGGSSHDMV